MTTDQSGLEAIRLTIRTGETTEKRLVVVGFRENLFHHHPRVEFFDSQWDMVRILFPEE